MTSSVQNRSVKPPLQHSHAEAVSRPSPGGVGETQTRMQSPAPQKGYIETAILAVRDFVVWLFRKIFFCFKKESSSPTKAHQDLLARLPHMTQEDRGDILKFFNAYFAKEEQEQILIEIGKAAPRSWRHLIGQSYTTIGEAMVQSDPTLLLPRLIRRVSEVVQKK